MNHITRSMEIEDLDSILTIEQNLFGKTAWSRNLFLDELSRVPNSRWYQVVVSNKEIIAYVGIAFTGETADIQTIAVAQMYQNHGLGSELLALALAKARETGAKDVFLEVAVENLAAINLYKRFGFTQLTIRPSYYGSGKDAFTMRLVLSDS